MYRAIIDILIDHVKHVDDDDDDDNDDDAGDDVIRAHMSTSPLQRV